MSERAPKKARLDPLAEQRALLESVWKLSPEKLDRLALKESENEQRVEVLYAAVDVALERCPADLGRYEYGHIKVDFDGRVKEIVVAANEDYAGCYWACSISKDMEVKYLYMPDWLSYCRDREKVRFRATVKKTLPEGVTLSFRTQRISHSVDELPSEVSTVVTGVEVDSAADRAGFRNGDVVVRMNGKLVRETETEITGKAELSVQQKQFIIFHAK